MAGRPGEIVDGAAEPDRSGPVLLLGDEHVALMGDLAEERAPRPCRRSAPGCERYRTEICRSFATAVCLRLADTVRSAPWSIAIGAYVLVAVLEVTMRLLLSRVAGRRTT